MRARNSGENRFSLSDVMPTAYSCDGPYGFLLWQSLLRLSFGSMGAAAVAGFSPDTTTFQPGSLPSSVSDALEAVVGQGVDDLSLDDLETGIPYAAEGQGGCAESEVRKGAEN